MDRLRLMLGGPRFASRIVLLVLVGSALIQTACATTHRPRSAVLVSKHPFVTKEEARSFAEIRRRGDPVVASGRAHVRDFVVRDRATVFCVDRFRDRDDVTEGADDERIRKLDGLLHSRVEELGFVVVGRDSVNEVRERVFGESPPLYDPHFGTRDDAVFAETRRRTLAELREVLGCDFLLIPSVQVVAAAWRDWIARWDGASRSITTLRGGGMGTYGTVGALSVHVTVVELEGGEEVFFGTGGIEPLAMLKPGATGSGGESVDSLELLRDDDANFDAIDLATRQLSRTVRDEDAERERLARMGPGKTKR